MNKPLKVDELALAGVVNKLAKEARELEHELAADLGAIFNHIMSASSTTSTPARRS